MDINHLIDDSALCFDEHDGKLVHNIHADYFNAYQDGLFESADYTSAFKRITTLNAEERDGNAFELTKPEYRFDDIEFLKKRIKNASNFSLSSILEDKPSVPFYEEITIPLGKVGGDTYSLVARTEKPPHPFILVTGTKGTGKSAFMHEIILSGAYKYSPDELEFVDKVPIHVFLFVVVPPAVAYP